MSLDLPTILFNAENRTIKFKLYDEEGSAPINLTGMTIYFNIGDSSTTALYSILMSLTTPATGECEVTFTPTQLTALGSGRFRYNIRQTAPTNRVLQLGFVQVEITFA